jgi:hypothetical protein
MFTHPDRIGQLAREHHHQMLAQASQRQLRHRHRRLAASTRIIRRLAAVIAGVGAAPAQPPDVIWTARPHPLGEPAGRTQTPGRRHLRQATPSTRAAASSPGRAAAQDHRPSGIPDLERTRMSVMCRASC